MDKKTKESTGKNWNDFVEWYQENEETIKEKLKASYEAGENEYNSFLETYSLADLRNLDDSEFLTGDNNNYFSKINQNNLYMNPGQGASDWNKYIKDESITKIGEEIFCLLEELGKDEPNFKKLDRFKFASKKVIITKLAFIYFSNKYLNFEVLNDKYKKKVKDLLGESDNLTSYEINFKLVKKLHKDTRFKSYSGIELGMILQQYFNSNLKFNEGTNNMLKNKILSHCNTILYGPPGTGKTYNSVMYAVNTINPAFSGDDKKEYKEYIAEFNRLKEDGQIAFTTFHQSYGYEEFIEGIKPHLVQEVPESENGEINAKKEISYILADGIFKRFCKIAKGDSSNNYIFIIDEINRGNISKIFGELITLIEDSKREGAKEAMSVSLPYSGQTFSVPNNVYILGTMNTADRSIALMDTALRRRFEFVEMMPDTSDEEEAPLKNMKVGEIDIRLMLETMNKRIELLYDREHTLGHAFFMGLKDTLTIDNLAKIFQNKIIPLLQEYFYEDYEKIMAVLGIEKDSDDQKKFISIVSDNIDDFISQFGDVSKTYQINKDAFSKTENYLSIYYGKSNSGQEGHQDGEASDSSDS